MENVYICECGEVLVTDASEAVCGRCKGPMENSGWCESINKNEAVKGPVATRKGKEDNS